MNGKGTNPTKRWDGMNKTLTLWQNTEPPNRNGNVFHREECRKVRRRREHDGCKHVHNPFDLFQKPFPMFRGGAAGSAATNRRRQEAELLNGPKQLLSNLNQHQMMMTEPIPVREDAALPRNGIGISGKETILPAVPPNLLNVKSLRKEAREKEMEAPFKNDQDANLVAALKALILEAETGGGKLDHQIETTCFGFLRTRRFPE